MKTIVTLLFLALIGYSCANESRIINAWTSAEKTKEYHDVVVVALTHDINAKKLVENDFASALARKGVTVFRSIDVFPPVYSKDILKDEMMAKVKDNGVDAIVTITLLNKETQTHYIPGYPGYAPGFWGYYSFWSPMVYSPGYYTQDRVYYIETNVYDVNTDQLIWSARSETYNPASLTGFSQNLASILATKLRKDDVITPMARHHVDKKAAKKTTM
jgi:hypothetical protein